MKFTVSKHVFQGLLDKAQNVIPNKSFLPVLNNFYIEANGGLRVVGTDLKLAVIASTDDAQVIDSGSEILPARSLFSIVHAAPSDLISIDVAGNEAKISTEHTTWTLKLMEGVEYPGLPDTTEAAFTKVDRVTLLDAIKSVRYAACTEATKPSLMIIDISDGKVRACDGIRFQEASVGEAVPINMQIPITAVEDLVKILGGSTDEFVHVAEDEDSLIFKLGSDFFITQKLNANFPDIDAIMKKPALANDEELVVDTADLMGAIKRARITADPDTSSIIIYLNTKEQMLVTSKDKFNSACVEELEVKWAGKKRKVAFNHVHLLQMLSMYGGETCHLFLGEDTKTRPSPICLRDEGMIGVLNQIRTDWLS